MTVSRRALLLGAASAASLAACSNAPAPLVTPTASPTGSVRDQLQQVMDAYGANTDQLGVSVKDLRTGHESGNPDRVFDGDIDDFIEAGIRWRRAQQDQSDDD